MTIFTQHFPADNDPAIGYNSVPDMLLGMKPQCSLGYINAQPLGKGEPVGDWEFGAWGAVATPASEAPYIQIQWGPQGGDFIQKRFHYVNALKGTWDWSDGYAPNNTVWDKTIDGATADFFLSKINDWVNTLNAAIVVGQLNGTNLVATQVSQQFQTDGPNAGLIWGIKHEWQYNPSASQFAAGQLPAFAAVFYQINFREADLNIFGVNGDANLAVSTVPVLTVQGTTQDAGWDDLSDSTLNISNTLNLINTVSNINLITNISDLGQPGAPDVQPAPGAVEFQTFGVPGALATITTTPSVLATIATWPGMAFAALYGLGRAALESIGLISPAIAASNALATNMAQLTNLGPLVTAVQSVTTELDDIQQDTFLIGGELEQIKSAFFTKGVPTDPDTFYDVVNNLQATLQLLAETKTDLTLKAKGIEVQAISGSITTGP